VRGDQRVVLSERVAAVARPRPVARVAGEPGAHRVLFDVAHAREQVAAHMNWRGVVALLPDGILVRVLVLQVARIPHRDGRHETCRAVFADRGQQQMHVVAHQRIGVYRAMLLLRTLTQGAQVRSAILRAGEARATREPLLDDVQRGVRFLRAGKARHAKSNAARRGAVDCASAECNAKHGPGKSGS